MEKRGIGAIFSSVLPGLITLAVESLTSWIKGKQQNRINQTVNKMRKTESEVKNSLSQYQDDFLMFGKYSIESLKKVINTLNALHDRQTELEKLVTTKVFTEAKHAGDSLDYSVELQLFLELAHKRNMSLSTKRFIKLGKNYWMQYPYCPRGDYPDHCSLIKD